MFGAFVYICVGPAVFAQLTQEFQGITAKRGLRKEQLYKDLTH